MNRRENCHGKGDGYSGALAAGPTSVGPGPTSVGPGPHGTMVHHGGAKIDDEGGLSTADDGYDHGDVIEVSDSRDGGPIRDDAHVGAVLFITKGMTTMTLTMKIAALFGDDVDGRDGGRDTCDGDGTVAVVVRGLC